LFWSDQTNYLKISKIYSKKALCNGLNPPFYGQKNSFKENLLLIIGYCRERIPACKLPDYAERTGLQKKPTF